MIALKNNKAAGVNGIKSEMYKSAGDQLIESIYMLMAQIRDEEMIPDWGRSLYVSLHNKRR